MGFHSHKKDVFMTLIVKKLYTLKKNAFIWNTKKNPDFLAFNYIMQKLKMYSNLRYRKVLTGAND